jgi:hypothetical protein
MSDTAIIDSSKEVDMSTPLPTDDSVKSNPKKRSRDIVESDDEADGEYAESVAGQYAIKKAKHEEATNAILKQVNAQTRGEDKLWTPTTFPKPENEDGTVLVKWRAADKERNQSFLVPVKNITDDIWNEMTAVSDYVLHKDDIMDEPRFQMIHDADSPEAAARLARAFDFGPVEDGCTVKAPHIYRLLYKHGYEMPERTRLDASKISAIIEIDEGDVYEGVDFTNYDEIDGDEEDEGEIFIKAPVGEQVVISGNVSGLSVMPTGISIGTHVVSGNSIGIQL